MMDCPLCRAPYEPRHSDCPCCGPIAQRPGRTAGIRVPDYATGGVAARVAAEADYLERLQRGDRWA